MDISYSIISLEQLIRSQHFTARFEHENSPFWSPYVSSSPSLENFFKNMCLPFYNVHISSSN